MGKWEGRELGVCLHSTAGAGDDCGSFTHDCGGLEWEGGQEWGAGGIERGE